MTRNACKYICVTVIVAVALTLAIVGSVKGVTNARESKVEYEFTKTVDEHCDTLKRVADGRLTASSQTDHVSDMVYRSSKLIGQLSGTRLRDSLAKFRYDPIGLERFYIEVARDSYSFQDFTQKTKGSLSTFSSLSEIRYGILENGVKKEIEQRQASRERLEKHNEATQEQLESQIRLRKLEGALNSLR